MRFANRGRAFWSLILIFVLLSSNLVAVFNNATVLAAGQLTSRSIKISSSKVSDTGVTYTATWNAASTTSVLGIVIDICQNTPIVGSSCTTASGVTNTPTTGTIQVTRTGSATTNVNFNVVSPSASTGLLALSHATGITSVVAGDTFTLNFTATNPSATGTFYGRILTYNTTSIGSYTHTSILSPIDTGGVAMSTANQLTLQARVQEQLSFCVATTDIDNATASVLSAGTNCSGTFSGGCGTTVDLGVIDSGATNISPVSTGNGGNACNGVALVQTNASVGVSVSYFAQADTGTNHLGALRVPGASCSASAVTTDQCFNSSTSQAAFTNGVEDFGVTVAGVNCGLVDTVNNYACSFSGGVYSLVRDAVYDGNGTNTYTSDANRVVGATNEGYAWDDASATHTLANSATGTIKVVDTEALILKFAATASTLTPAGSYKVISTYIATATY